MHKIQKRMAASRPYLETMKSILTHLRLNNLEYKYSYVKEHDTKLTGYLIILTNRSLCDGLNINLFK